VNNHAEPMSRPPNKDEILPLAGRVHALEEVTDVDFLLMFGPFQNRVYTRKNFRTDIKLPHTPIKIPISKMSPLTWNKNGVSGNRLNNSPSKYG